MLNDTVTCEICGLTFKQINHTHLRKHNITVSEYIKTFPLANLWAGASIEKLRHSEERKRQTSIATTGKNNPNYGKKHSAETRKKISDNHADMSGKNNPFYGKSHTVEARRKNAEAHIGRKHTRESLMKISKASSGENNPRWLGGVAYEPYCIKFNNKFKEIIRNRYDRICFLCGKDEETNGRRLDVHHVNYDKNCLCDDSVCEFVPLCMICHMKTNNDRNTWESHINEKINVYNSIGVF